MYITPTQSIFNKSLCSNSLYSEVLYSYPFVELKKREVFTHEKKSYNRTIIALSLCWNLLLYQSARLLCP